MVRAVGNKLYGHQYKDQISETLRKAAEHCDCLQSFFLLHSMGGGLWVCEGILIEIWCCFIRNWLRSRDQATGDPTGRVS